jgi:AcrR family transcriptional regulator
MPATPPDLPRVREGVFFTTPPQLPRGRHSLSREEILASQRERMLIAATEVLAAGGVKAVTARSICARAGASLQAFYDCFETKESCVFEAYGRFIGGVLERIVATDGEGRTWEEYVTAVVGSYFGALSQDLVVARAFQVEMDSLGELARQRRREALTALAELIMTKHVEWDPAAAQGLPLTAYVAAVYGVRQLASDCLDTGRVEDFASLEEEVSGWVARMFDAGAGAAATRREDSSEEP